MLFAEIQKSLSEVYDTVSVFHFGLNYVVICSLGFARFKCLYRYDGRLVNATPLCINS